LKIIHCADLHLASALGTSLSAEKARTRRSELLIQFKKMIEYAQQNGVSCIIIAGDLFDASAVPLRTAEHVFDMMRGASDIQFLYLRGNHDCAGLTPDAENILVVPQDGKWVYTDVGGVTVALCDVLEGQTDYPETLSLPEGCINIAVLHGEVSPTGKSEGSKIALTDFKNKHISYLALGHYHSYFTDVLDDGGVYCYSGCLEGRGFDECGKKGFVLLEIGEESFTYDFIPFSLRTLHDIAVDVTDCASMPQIESAVMAALSSVSSEDMVRLTLTGALPAEVNRDIEYLSKLLPGRFFAARVHDKTTLLIDPADYAGDASLKGAFVGGVLESDLSEEEKQRVLSLGLAMLLGGEVNV
jgi:DNA repair exonuclease SbcCD nuclease subunit